MTDLLQKIKALMKDNVASDSVTLKQYSRDASIFEVQPEIVVFPKDAEDIQSIVKFVSENKTANPELSITARSAGTDMSGGPLGQSIVLVFTKYLNHLISIGSDSAIVEPGLFYRDFERQTLQHDLLLPSYPASREICALGGMISNNSGGEKSLVYGKTERYVKELKVVLSDGNEYDFRPLNETELQNKMSQKNFEGQVYRDMYQLITQNYELITNAKPKVSKNSAGYYLWNVWDPESKIFDLTKLFVGAQGTLGLVTEAKLRLVPIKKYSRTAVIFLKNTAQLAEIAAAVRPLGPESFESYDDHTFRLAIKYFPSFAKLLGTRNILSLTWQFLPELMMTLRGGIPKLVMIVEFTGDQQDELSAKILSIQQKLAPFHDLKLRIIKNPQEAKKYWVMRRESFNLLRHKIKDQQATPFIDDIIVRPEKLDQFLPQLNAILEQYHLTYTLAGHVGDGNFHIIPLMNLADQKDRDIIHELSHKVYDLVLRFGGSITAEHNDGIIRTPYLKQMYGEEVYRLFEETKRIFDPLTIFNPGKKVGGDMEFALAHIKKS